MRNKRGAFWALAAAGAAYVWRNREQLRQQFEQFRGTQSPPSTSSQAPHALPDYSNVEQREFGAPSTTTDREFTGTRF